MMELVITICAHVATLLLGFVLGLFVQGIDTPKEQ